MTDLNTTLVKQFLNVPLAEGEAVVEPQGIPNDTQRESMSIGLPVSHSSAAYQRLVARTPLEVLSFTGGDFGEIADAVNLVNGNVYLDLGPISRNNTLKTGEDTAGSFGNFKTNGILRLAGFSLTMPTLPNEWLLGVGDGSYQVFSKVDATSPRLPASPTWIKGTSSTGVAGRYANITSDIAFYVTKPLNGTQINEEWIVTYKRSDGNYVSHYYDHTGNRTTFLNDGEYADFAQTPHQQYQTAKASATSDGADGVSGSLKTQFTYQSLNSGRVTRVEDGFGRVTAYGWNADGTLADVSILLQNPAVTTSWARRIEYAYSTFGSQRMVTYMGFRTFSGRGSAVGRWFSFSYEQVGSTWLLNEVRRPIMSSGSDGNMGTTKNITNYGYDSMGRVISINETNKEPVSFTYEPYGDGIQVTKTSGNATNPDYKKVIHYYNSSGWLYKISRRNYDPNTGAEYETSDSYGYNDNGQIISIDQHASSRQEGKDSQIGYVFDSRGNRRIAAQYMYTTAAPELIPAGYVRASVNDFDRDNRLVCSTNTSKSLTSATNCAGMAHAGEYKNTTTYTEFPRVTAGGQSFQALASASMLRVVNGVPGTSLSVVTTFNETGLVAEETRSGTGVASLKTTYQYHGNRAVNKEIVVRDFLSPLSSGEVDAYLYSDMLAAKIVNGQREEYSYNRYGHVIRTLKKGAHVFSWSGGASPVASTADSEHRFAYNGFGQIIYEVLREHYSATKYADIRVRQWKYNPSGELLFSWEGQPSNLTKYTISTLTGLVEKIESGPGIGETIPSVRTTTIYGYDTLESRITSTNVNGNVQQTVYDTLDRIAKVVRPDASIVKYGYAPSGGLNREEIVEPDDTVVLTTYGRDNLDRETSRSLPTGGSITTFYDAFDHPIEIRDGRLNMLSTDDDKTTYLVYDAVGNLVKRLDPVLIAAGPPYSDLRRPYTEWKYDDYGQQIEERKLLSGATLSPTNMTLPPDAEVAVSSITSYDAFGRPLTVVDALGYTTTIIYDNAGNPISATKQIWKTTEKEYASVQPTYQYITTRKAYNGLGAEVENWDAKGRKSVTQYNSSEKPILVTDERNIVVNAYTYTPDNLLEKTFEPDNDNATSSILESVAYANLNATHVVTEYKEYGMGIHPTTIWQAYMDTPAGKDSGAKTTMTYDYAGRVLITTSPPDKSSKTIILENRYDSRGNITYSKDVDGFIKTMKYDESNNITESSTSGLSFPLISKFDYDLAGNLTLKNEKGIVTEYKYNSMGKVVAESRPRVQGSALSLWKLVTYRLDGLPTAKTSYSYQGNLTTIPAFYTPSNVTVVSGNLTLFTHDARGNMISEVSRGTNALLPEYSKDLYFNGASQQYHRKFTGRSDIYSAQRDKNGGSTGSSNYLTYWMFDENGNLSSSWKTPASSGTTDIVALDSSFKQDLFAYNYSATNKQMNQSRDVQVRYKGLVNSNALSTTYGGTKGVLIAASIASSTTEYTERDQVLKVTTNDSTPQAGAEQSSAGVNVADTTTFTYYTDGRLKSRTSGGTSVTFDDYDQIGREVQVTDNNGEVLRRITALPSGSPYDPNQIASGVIKYSYSPGTKTINIYNSGGTLRSTHIISTGPDGLKTYEYTYSKDLRYVEGYSKNTITTSYYTTGLVSSVSSAKEDYNQSNGVKSTYISNISQSNSYNSNAQLTTTSQTMYAKTTKCTSTSCDVPYQANNTTKIQDRTYDDDGNVKSELVNYLTSNGIPTTSYVSANYTLDSRGNRLEYTGPNMTAGFSKRYDADDRISSYAKSLGKEFHEADSAYHGISFRYNDFRYDPFGNQVINSSGHIGENDYSTRTKEYRVARDYSNSHYINSETTIVLKRQGSYSIDWSISEGKYKEVDSYSNSPIVVRDSTYSAIDGEKDGVDWTGDSIILFNSTSAISALDAPIKPLIDSGIS